MTQPKPAHHQRAQAHMTIERVLCKMRRDDSDPESLMREADVAMYTAKGRGKNRVEPYDATLNDAVDEHLALKA